MQIKIPFTKCHANGNDFIFLLSNELNIKMLNNSIIKQLCNRHLGIGADGLFVISDSNQCDFLLDYYNSDGSWETLCANGSRCAVLLMNKLNKIKNKCTFMAGDGQHFSQILSNDMVEMEMRTPVYKTDLISPEGFDGYFINSGARHFVCENKNLNDDYIYNVGKKIRNSDFFSPKGVNVNFFHINKDGNINVKTYEKGVENVMFSCASGSTAVVFHLAQTKMIKETATTTSPGGSLIFSFDEAWENVRIMGPAKIVFSGQYFLNKI